MRKILSCILPIWLFKYISDNISVGVRANPDGNLSGAVSRHLQTLAG